MSRLRHKPAELADANAFVGRLHRHHKRVPGHRFSIGAWLDDKLVGVVIVGRPASRVRQRADPLLVEITRLCTDGTRNACSFLYGRAARAAAAIGYRRIGTYTLPEEGGASLRAAGFQLLGTTKGGKWSRDSRPRSDDHPTGPKWVWERNLHG